MLTWLLSIFSNDSGSAFGLHILIQVLTNYKFTIDVLLGTPENKYFVSKLIICSINDNLFIFYICKYSFIHVMLLYMINHGLK